MVNPILFISRKIFFGRRAHDAFASAMYQLSFFRITHSSNYESELQFSEEILQDAIDICFREKNYTLLYMFEGAKNFDFGKMLKDKSQEDRDVLDNLARASLLRMARHYYWRLLGDD